MAGPLANLRIVEFASLGPTPFACMMLADNGADLIQVRRTYKIATDDMSDPAKDVLNRSRRVISLDLKNPEHIARVRDIVRSADAVVEGYRPGVMEKLGLGPELLLEDNPRLVYGRMTGWGQTGPLAKVAGHDINYIGLSGALHVVGRAGEAPLPPVNLVGDFGGGGMLLAFGLLSALLHSKATGQGQVVDCSMVDGSALLMSLLWSLRAGGQWRDDRGTNIVDTGAHFYETYETLDGQYVAIGSIEPQFYALLREKLGIVDDPDFDAQFEPAAWPALKRKLAAIFLTKTRADWCKLLESTDVCFAPVLSMAEAPYHPHNVARQTFVEVDGVIQPAPGPRYSATPCSVPKMPFPGQDDSAAILRDIAPCRQAGGSWGENQT